MHGLMVPHFHAQPSTNTSAYDSKHQQGSLRYATTTPFSLKYIYAINEEGQDIYSYEALYYRHHFNALTGQAFVQL